ncbi:MAG: metallophosphoesterase [Bauldia litoralis]
MFTLVQLSDPHLGPLPSVRWRQLASKRIFGYVNWHRNRAADLGPKNLRVLVDELLDRPRDHIAVTGDLINIGLSPEIDAAAEWLAALGAPTDVTAVPGNHDAYLPSAIRHYEMTWHPFMIGDDHGDAPVVFPFTRIRGPVAIIGLSSAVATAPLMATGRIRQPQADRLEAELKRLGEAGLFRVVLIHHPPAIDSAPWSRRLIGASNLRKALGNAGAELVLHGHNHHTTIDKIEGPSGPIPVIGASSASLPPHHGRHGGSYLTFRIAATNGGFECDMEERGTLTDDGAIETLTEKRLVGPGVS